MCKPKAARTVVVTNSQGLHARAATLVAELARKFDAAVKLVKDSQRVEATEVMQILLLVAAQGDQLSIEATGHDAQEAVDTLARLFAGNFDEETGEKKAEETENRQ